MAVTLTVDELAAALRLGDSAEELAEATRLHAYATEAITKQAPAAPDVAANEAAIRLTGYLFDQPTASRADSYANAMRNSGAGRMMLPYVTHSFGSTVDETPTSAPDGFRRIGLETVTVAAARLWVATALPVPTTTVGGVNVLAPDGTETGIELFRVASLEHQSAAVGGDATAVLDRMFAIELAADRVLLFASKQTGRHTIYLYEVT